MLAVLINKRGKLAASNPEIEEMLLVLEAVGEEAGRSFFTTRKAEYEYLCGNNRVIQTAVSRTPHLFEPRRLHAQILLRSGNKAKAHDAITVMKEMVYNKESYDRRSNFRAYLQTLSDYLLEVKDYDAAKRVYSNADVFTPNEKLKATKAIEVAQAYYGRKG